MYILFTIYYIYIYVYMYMLCCCALYSETKQYQIITRTQTARPNKLVQVHGCKRLQVCRQSGMTCTGTTHIGPPAQTGKAVEGKGARRKMICTRSEITVPIAPSLPNLNVKASSRRDFG